jgi:hypothetical protein
MTTRLPACEVSVPIATDETLALDDLQQRRPPIIGLLARP